MGHIQILAITTSIMFMLLVFELMRNRRLEEKFALSWLIASFFFLLISTNVGLINRLAKLTGVISPPNALFIVALLFLILISLSLTVSISTENKKNSRLMQEMTILKEDIERIKSAQKEKDKKV